MRYTLSALLGAVLLTFTSSACRQAGSNELVVYSGRSKPLVDSLVQVYRAQSGVPVSVRYGTDAQLLAALQEEGSRSPADVFWANTAGALTQAGEASLLVDLPGTLLERPGSFVPESGLWTPLTARFRVLAYNADRVDSDDLPDTVLDLPELEQYAGRIGWTPAYSSFQDFVTAMREIHGADTTRAWINAMQTLDPKGYGSNTPMVQAIAAGEIDVALTNHYYVFRLRYGGPEGEFEHAEVGETPPVADPEAPVEMYHFATGDVGNLALATGAAQLATSDQPGDARRFLQFLLSDQAQRFAATRVNEYPVVEDVEVPAYMTPVREMLQISPAFDYEQLSDLGATLRLLRDEGVL